MASEKFTAEQVIEAINKTRGMITYTAEYLDCAPNTVRRYIEKYVTVANAMDEAKERLADNVENTLYDVAIGKRNKDGSFSVDPNVTALIFLAKTHPALRKRGYMEANRTEIANADDKPFEVKTTIDIAGMSDDELRALASNGSKS